MLPFLVGAAGVSAWKGFASGVSLGVSVYKAIKQ